MAASTDTDIIIVGGGLVGALLAKLLSTLNLSVVLIEKKFLAPTEHAAFADTMLDRRALALNFGTLGLFKKLLQLDLAALGTKVQHIYVSDQGGFGRVALDAAKEGLPYFGAVIPMLRLTQTLQALVLDDPRIHCVEGVCSELLEEEHVATVTIETAAGIQDFKAKLVVGADGAESKVRSLLGLSVATKDYGQTALIGNVNMRGVQNATAFERFTTEGPLALLPLDAEHMTVAWVMPTQVALMRQQLPAAMQIQDLQNIMGYRAGSFSSLGAITAYPLKQVLLEATEFKRVGLLGNAAHSIHPVAGQGFNLSVRDVLGFYQSIKAYQGDLSQAARIWQDYNAVRGHDQNRTLRITDNLIKLFGKSNRLFSLLRNSLLLQLELMPILKRELNEIMVGL